MSFEILPLVEFQLEEGISDREACALIETSTGASAESSGGEVAAGADESQVNILLSCTIAWVHHVHGTPQVCRENYYCPLQVHKTTI